MIVETPIFTVADICRRALPLDTTVVAGGGAIARPVRWVVTAAPDAPLPYLEGDELVLLTPTDGDITPTLRACAEKNVAAVATSPPIAPVALATAEMLGLPVIQLPVGSRIRDIERTVLGLILDRHNQIEHLSMQIYQQLIQLVSENVGLDQIVHMLGKYTNRAVVLQDKHLRIKYTAVTPQLAEEWESIAEILKERRALPEALRDRHKLLRYTALGVRQQLRADGLQRLVVPIVNKGIGRGYLSFVAPNGQAFDDIDMLIINHGAVVCALEMARAKAISEVEKKLRGDFLTSLMAGTLSDAEVQAEGDRFGHDMSAPHVAIVMTWYGDKRPSDRRLETLVNGLVAGLGINVLSQLRENELRLFYTNDSPDLVQSARQLAEEFIRAARREYRNARVAIGIGTVAPRVSAWRASYHEAANAADIARRLQSDVPLYAGDLDIYTFLARPEFRDDLRTLRDKMIGNLLKHEERQRADLLQTLEAFFQCHGNHTQTAEMLSVHRNTLFYRMNRIAEITGLDLNQPDVRLAAHLALKIHRLLTAEP